MSKKQNLVLQIATEIENWLKEGRILASTNRPISPADILILVQARGGKGGLVEKLINALALKNIPTSGLDRLKLSDNLAIKDLIALINFTQNPFDELNLSCLLISPIIQLSYEQLTELCVGRLQVNLFDYIASHSQELHLKLQNYRQIARQNLIPSHFLVKILYGANLLELYTQIMGEVATDVLLELINLAVHYEKSTIAPNLYEFAAWLENNQSEIKRDLDSSEGRLRIMTVHGSKGLEAPVVILADCDRTQVDKEYFGEFDLGDQQLLLFKPKEAERFGIFAVAQTQANEARMAEYWRLLYVALTRAADELHIFGSGNKKDSWYEKLEQVIKTMPNVKLYDDGKMQYHSADQPENEASSKAKGDKTSEIFAPLPLIKAPKPPFKSHFTQVSQITSNNSVQYKASPPMQDDIPPQLRGNVVHKLLQYQAGNKYADFLHNVDKLLVHILKDFATELPDELQKKLLRPFYQIAENKELVALLEMPAISEMPVVGDLNNMRVSAQIDRFIINSSEIYIIDFKTSENDLLNQSYIDQLLCYKNLVESLYPSHNVNLGLLYVNSAPQYFAI
jgi:ATP-dependent helicase/nuclease subunit A